MMYTLAYHEYIKLRALYDEGIEYIVDINRIEHIICLFKSLKIYILRR